MNTSGESAENEDPKPENNDLSNAGMNPATSGPPPGPPVSSSVNTEGEASKPETNAPSNKAESGASDGLPSGVPVSPNLNLPEDTTKKLSIIKRRATGPVRRRGKERSKRNAVKHGIFSSPVLLGEQNPTLYRSLLQELDESLDPQGMLESLLVEKLATMAWRYRRLLLAESAAIHKNIEDLEELKEKRLMRELDLRHARIGDRPRTDKVGAAAKIDIPIMLQDCCELLDSLQEEVATSGFDPGSDPEIPLSFIYGARYEGRPDKDLFDIYHDCLNAWRSSDVERQKRGFASKDDCVTKFLVELDKENQRFACLLKKHPYFRKRKPDFELFACKVPDTPDLDRLLRYEASLERAFDRTLNQLERLQRMRKGQPVPAPISVNVSVL